MPTATPVRKRRPGQRIPVKQAHHAPTKGPPPTIDNDAAKHVAMGLSRKDPAVWFENFGRIVGKEGELIKPKINTLQRRVYEAWKYCRDKGLPCRIILCKPRQKGSSTWATALLYWICQAMPQTTRARIMGGKYSQVKNLWDMMDVYATNDTCVWPRGRADVFDDRVDVGPSEVTKETANNPDAGRSGTFRVVIITELGRWREAGVAAAKKVLSGMLNCVPKEPGTLVIIESTAQGIGGEFHSRYWKASPLAAFKAGRRGSGYIRVFAAWFEFPDSWVDLTDDEARDLEADLNEEEIALRDRFDLVLEQLAWRRATIADDCDGDLDLFKQEFPSTEEEAFLSSGRPRFDRAGLMAQGELSKEAQRDLETGDITLSDDYRPAFTPCPEEECVFHVYENPSEGREYLLVNDPATGATQAMGLDPDCHSVIVLRKGYIDENGQWHQPAIAARIRPPRKGYRDGCRWDGDVLEAAIYRLALYYGNCRIVIEMNKDTGVTELLKLRGRDPTKPLEPTPRLYEREVFNERDKRMVKALGWMTTTANREALVNTVAAAIRTTGEEGGGIELRCPHAVAECRQFEIDEKGKSTASSGWHDDDVLALAIGLTTLGHATVYREARVSRPLPAEVRKIKAKSGAAKKRPGMFS